MGINYHVGPAVDVTTLALDRSISEDDVLFSTGFASVEDYADLYDEDELADDYLDAILYDFAYKYIPEISSLPQCFSYYSDPVTQHVYVHADAEEMFDYHIGNPAAIVALKQAFGDVEVKWLAAHSY